MDKLDKIIEIKLRDWWLQEQLAENKKKGHSVNIEDETIGNDNFRKVLYTGENTQLVLMSIKPGEDIGSEVHHGIDQFFRVESGDGEAIINGNVYKITDGFSVIVPAGAEHNFVNTGTSDLKLYSLYSPPHHKDGIIHKTKADAIQDKEKFDGKTTES
jgi:mannose-6-phosphate isomerase-like protein (cupin superfamily)